MAMTPLVFKSVSERYKAIDEAVKAGRIDFDSAIRNYAWMARKDLPGNLMLAQPNSADPSQDGIATHSIPFTISKLEEDRDGDIVMPLGCRLDDYAKNPVVFFGHQENPYPIAKSAYNGQLKVWTEENRIRAVAYFDHEDPDAMFVESKIRRGFLSAASIAFVPLQAEKREYEYKAHHADRSLGWRFSEYTLTEWSVVGIPSCAGAIRDALDSEKSFITHRLQKAMKPYAALSKQCFNGWCECPCEEKKTLTEKVKSRLTLTPPKNQLVIKSVKDINMPKKSCGCKEKKSCSCNKKSVKKSVRVGQKVAVCKPGSSKVMAIGQVVAIAPSGGIQVRDETNGNRVDEWPADWIDQDWMQYSKSVKDMMKSPKTSKELGGGVQADIETGKPAARIKDAMQDCISHKIPIIAHDHPDMKEDQRIAEAYSICGEKKGVKPVGMEEMPGGEKAYLLKEAKGPYVKIVVAKNKRTVQAISASNARNLTNAKKSLGFTVKMKSLNGTSGTAGGYTVPPEKIEEDMKNNKKKSAAETPEQNEEHKAAFGSEGHHEINSDNEPKREAPHAAQVLANLHQHLQHYKDYLDQESPKFDPTPIKDRLTHKDHGKAIDGLMADHAKDFGEHYPDLDMKDLVSAPEHQGDNSKLEGEAGEVAEGNVPPEDEAASTMDSEEIKDDEHNESTDEILERYQRAKEVRTFGRYTACTGDEIGEQRGKWYVITDWGFQKGPMSESEALKMAQEYSGKSLNKKDYSENPETSEEKDILDPEENEEKDFTEDPEENEQKKDLTDEGNPNELKMCAMKEAADYLDELAGHTDTKAMHKAGAKFHSQALKSIMDTSVQDDVPGTGGMVPETGTIEHKDLTNEGNPEELKVLKDASDFMDAMSENPETSREHKSACMYHSSSLKSHMKSIPEEEGLNNNNPLMGDDAPPDDGMPDKDLTNEGNPEELKMKMFELLTDCSKTMKNTANRMKQYGIPLN
jgi:hypothetical protein